MSLAARLLPVLSSPQPFLLTSPLSNLDPVDIDPKCLSLWARFAKPVIVKFPGYTWEIAKTLTSATLPRPHSTGQCAQCCQDRQFRLELLLTVRTLLPDAQPT